MAQPTSGGRRRGGRTAACRKGSLVSIDLGSGNRANRAQVPFLNHPRCADYGACSTVDNLAARSLAPWHQQWWHPPPMEQHRGAAAGAPKGRGRRGRRGPRPLRSAFPPAPHLLTAPYHPSSPPEALSPGASPTSVTTGPLRPRCSPPLRLPAAAPRHPPSDPSPAACASSSRAVRCRPRGFVSCAHVSLPRPCCAALLLLTPHFDVHRYPPPLSLIPTYTTRRIPILSNSFSALQNLSKKDISTPRKAV